MKCIDCKHWWQDGFEEWTPVPILLAHMHPCGRIERYGVAVERQGAEPWPEPEDEKKTTDALIREVAVCYDAEEYQAELYTRDDFGCVLFERRSTSEPPADGSGGST